MAASAIVSEANLATWSVSDWTALVNEANDESLVSWLIYRLPICPFECPAPVAAYCSELAATNARWSVLNARLTLDICARLLQSGIAVRVIKGPLAGLSIYGDVRLRNSGDIDLVVSPSDASRAATVLLDAGFRSEIDITWLENLDFLKSHRELSFTDLGGAFDIDLHWALHYPWVADVIPVPVLLSERSVALQFEGTSIPWMSDVVLWLVHFANILNTQSPELKSYVDLAHLSDRLTEGDWEKVIAACQSARAGAALVIVCGVLDSIFKRKTLSVARRLLGATFNEARIAAQCSRIASDLSGACETHIHRLSFWQNTQFISTWQQRVALARAAVEPSIQDFALVAPGTHYGTVLARALRRRIGKIASHQSA